MRAMASNGISPSPFFPPNFLLQMQQTPSDHDPQEQQQHHHHQHHHHHEHHHLPAAPPLHPHHHNPFLPSSQQCPSFPDFRGMAPAMLGKRPMYGGGAEVVAVGGEEAVNNEEEVSDDGSQQLGGGEKKRRLNVEQVRTLERSFEVGNKLEPERKLQLARALGLQPRQVAIWFQNRRARWKTKQLEKDYDALKRQLDAVTARNDALLSHNKKLQAEILSLKGGREAGSSELINLNKETEASCSNRSENSSEINLDISRTPPSDVQGPLDHPPPPPPPTHQHGGMIPFYPSVGGGRPTAAGGSVDIDHLLHTSTPKLEQHGNGGGGAVHAAETTAASFGNLLCGVDEPPPFWPWADHQHFH